MATTSEGGATAAAAVDDPQQEAGNELEVGVSGDPLACVEPTSAHRYFGVDLFRKDGQLLGLRIDQQNGILYVGDMHVDEGPVAEWNRNCDKSFPDDKLEKGDLIIRVNGIGVGKSTNVEDNGRTEILVAMRDELRDKQKEGYLLVVERKVTKCAANSAAPGW